jgi:hypothetical protein
MKSAPIAVALGLIIAAALSARAGTPSKELVVNAVGTGVTETWGGPAQAVAQPTRDAAGAGTEILAAPPAATAKEERK